MCSESVSGNIPYIEPAFAKESETIRAYFSLKNAEKVNLDGKVPGLNIGYNTREDAGRVKENRATLCEDLNLHPDWIALGDQVHSNRVRVVSEAGTYPETDGLVTTVPRLTLAIQVADCAAVLLADKKNGVIAAVHAGWRGAASGIVENALQSMQRQDARISDIEAYISPCICEKHFEVGSEVAEQFPDSVVNRASYTKPHVNLKGFLEQQLMDYGISNSSIEVDGGCTFEHSDKFYSYRREGKKSGRMFALIQLK